MNVSRVALMRCIIRGARENNSTDPKAALKAILKSRFASEVTNGTTIVSTSSDGHAVSFALPDNLAPAEVMVLVEEALTWLEAQLEADVTNSTKLPRAIHRLRASFDKAAI
jgi:predicted metal-dependent hydrolase